jgi:hypothetical protein
MTQARSATPASIVECGYQAWLSVDERVSGFPRDARRALGHRAVDALLDALVATIEAAYLPKGRERISRLEAANRRLSVARILLRGARDRRRLPVPQHDNAMRLLDDWGRQLGGWLRFEPGGDR